jgi:NitT/TauT family transport system substrate-binding protein
MAGDVAFVRIRYLKLDYPFMGWLLLLFCLLFSGCEQKSERQHKQANPLPVVIGISGSIFAFPLALADEMDFFSAEGLQAEIKQYGSGKQALQALLKGDVAFCTSAEAAIVKVAFERSDFVVLATFIRSYAHGKVVARSDRGIERVEDLVGKKIGLAMGTTGEFYLHRLLAEHHMKIESVTVQNLQTTALMEAILNGKVDAVSSWEPWITKISDSLAEQARVFSNENVLRNTFNLVTMGKSLDSEHAIMAERIIRAISRAVVFAQKHPQQAKAIMSQRLAITPETIEKIWNDYRPGLLLDQALILTMEAQARWYLDRTQAQRPVPNFLDLIDAKVLKHFNPDLVDPTF